MPFECQAPLVGKFVELFPDMNINELTKALLLGSSQSRMVGSP